MTIEKGHLIFWWHHYGKMVYTLEELQQFEKIIDDYGVDKVFEVVIASYICADGSPTILLTSIRNNIVEDLFNSLPDVSKMNTETKKSYEKTKTKLIKLLTEQDKNE